MPQFLVSTGTQPYKLHGAKSEQTRVLKRKKDDSANKLEKGKIVACACAGGPLCRTWEASQEHRWLRPRPQRKASWPGCKPA